MNSQQRAPSGVWFTAGSLANIVLALSIVGCASLRATPGKGTDVGSATLASRQFASAFTAAGRVAARVTGDNTRGFSGGFSWIHRPAGDTIELLTPLGQIAARLSVTKDGATIELSDGSQTRREDPEGLLSEAFGVSLPLAALPNWFQGIPVPGSPYRAEADTLGRPVTIWQNGWQIQYSDYANDTTSANPARLHLTHGSVEARMIISEWSVE